MSHAAASLAALVAEKARRERVRAEEAARAEAERLAEEAAEERAQVELAERWGKVATAIRATLYDRQQAAFVEEKAGRVAMLCTRRAGKTFGGIREMVAYALDHARCRQLYVNETRDEAKALAWDEPDDGIISVLNAMGMQRGEKRGVEGDYWANETELVVRFRNGSFIKLYGADDERQLHKLRGRKWHRVWVDEAQKLPHLQVFVQQVVGASMADFEGQIWITGTPSLDTSGYFFEITRDDGQPPAPGWEVHRWSVVDNPFFGVTPEERWNRTAAKALEENGWTEEEPDFRREWLGRWVITDANFVYPVHATKRPHLLTFAPMRLDASGLYDHVASERDLPRGVRGRPQKWVYSIGVDFGFDPDGFAIVLIAFSMTCETAFEMWSWKRTRTDAVEQKERLDYLFRHVDGIVSIVGDPAGQRALLKGWRERMGLPIEEADKHGKDTWIDLMGSDIRRNRFRYRDGSPLLDEHRHLVWLPVKNGKRVAHKHRKLLDGRVPGDHCFVAGTMIETEHGPRAIETLAPGMRVWTRQGLRPVLMTGLTGIEPTWLLESESGASLVGTRGHRIWTDDGWAPLGNLTPVSMLTEWRGVETSTVRPKSSSSRGSSIGDIPSRIAATCASTSRLSAAATSIARFGRMLTARFQTAITSIISMATRSTTSCATWPASRQESITASTCWSAAPIQCFEADSMMRSGKPGLQPPSGTVQTLGASGTPSMAGRSPPSSRPRCATRPTASCAACASAAPRAAPCAATSASPSNEGIAASMTSSSPARSAAGSSCAVDTRSPSSAPCRVTRAIPTGLVQPVYNLAVEGVHEYFANGILVANCSDAALYAWRHAANWLARPDVGERTQEERMREEEAALEREVDQAERHRPAKDDDGWDVFEEGWG